MYERRRTTKRVHETKVKGRIKGEDQKGRKEESGKRGIKWEEIKEVNRSWRERCIESKKSNDCKIVA